MSTELFENRDRFDQNLSRVHALFGQLRVDTDPDRAAQLTELETTLDAMAAEFAAWQEVRDSSDELVSIFGLEFRAVISAAEGFTEVLLNQLHDPLSPKQVKFLNNIAKSTQRMRELVEDFSLLVQIREGGIRFIFEPVALREVVMARVQGRMARQIYDRGQTLQIDIPDNLPALWVDLWRMEHVMNELVTNACKFTPDGGSITVSAEAVEDRVRVSVSDTGIGMTPSQLARLGQLFYRGERQQVQEKKGTGLGFHITQHLVRMMDGEIEVESTPDEGSTFSLTLPIAP